METIKKETFCKGHNERSFRDNEGIIKGTKKHPFGTQIESTDNEEDKQVERKETFGI